MFYYCVFFSKMCFPIYAITFSIKFFCQVLHVRTATLTDNSNAKHKEKSNWGDFSYINFSININLQSEGIFIQGILIGK